MVENRPPTTDHGPLQCWSLETSHCIVALGSHCHFNGVLAMSEIWDIAVYQMFKSHSEYLVTNSVQVALPSNKRQKAKHFFEYFWLGMTLRPEGSRNLF